MINLSKFTFNGQTHTLFNVLNFLELEKLGFGWRHKILNNYNWHTENGAMTESID